jgi:CRP-like cAMP-binding protein
MIVCFLITIVVKFIKGDVNMPFKQDEIDFDDLGERVLISVPARVNKYPRGEYAMFLQPSFIKLAKDSKFSVSARILFFYMAVAEYDNRIKAFTHQEISDVIGVARPNISKATKELVESGVIFKEGRDLYFSEDYIMKGVRKYRVTNKKTDEDEEENYAD